MLMFYCRAVSFALLALYATFASWSVAAQPLTIVTTTADLQSIAAAVGGNRVHAISLATAHTNSETFQPRPQDLQRLKQADLVVRIGLDYDLWLDGLIQKAARADINKRGKAYVDASYGIGLLEIRSASLDASSGHGHGAGNPHYWLDPHNAAIISANILDGLRRIDPTQAKFYADNHHHFVQRLDEKQREWQARLAPLSGKPVLAYHDSWAYFARRFRLRIVDVIEPKPGIPASPSRVVDLIKRIKQQHIIAILKQPYDPIATPKLLSQKTGIPIVVLASSVGALPDTEDYFRMMDFNIDTLLAGTTR